MSDKTQRPRFEVLKFKVRRDSYGSSARLVEVLNRKLKRTQSIVYLKHNTLVNDTAYWTAIVENHDFVSLRVRLPKHPRKFAKFAGKKSGGRK